jgi:hypothetical protein
MLDFSRFTHLTFDCYGTLIDWEAGILAALQPLLTGHGLSLPDEQVLELFGELEAAAEAGPYQPYSAVLTTVLAGFGERLGFILADDEREAPGPLGPRLAAVPRYGRGPRRAGPALQAGDPLEYRRRTLRRFGAAFADRLRRRDHGAAGRQLQTESRQFPLRAAKTRAPVRADPARRPELFHDIAPAKEVG